MKFIAQVCEKHTKLGLSDIFQIEADHVYEAADILEQRAQMKIDGYNNYAEIVKDQHS